MSRVFRYFAAALLAILFLPAGVPAQENDKDKAAGTPAAEHAKPVYLPPSVRLAAAKTAVVQNAGGSELPYNVISSGLEGWGRFRLVESRAEADIIIEVASPDEESTSTKSKTHVGAGGRMEESTTTTTRNLTNGAIRLVVYDARTHMALWSASELPKGAFRSRAREEHLVEAASRLLTKLRERIEPPPSPK